MGIEYKIPCRSIAPEAWDGILRQAPGFARVEPTYGQYEFRAPGNGDFSRMPDAWAGVEPDGIYFCDNGGGEVVGSVLAHLEQTITRTGEPFSPHEL